jgi:rhamnose transport system permease protein
VSRLGRYKRELAAGLALLILLVVVGLVAPRFFTAANLGDLALNNAPLLLVATGMTLVILVGQIDISVGSQFAVVSVAAGILAKAGVPVLL